MASGVGSATHRARIQIGEKVREDLLFLHLDTGALDGRRQVGVPPRWRNAAGQGPARPPGGTGDGEHRSMSGGIEWVRLRWRDHLEGADQGFSTGR